MNFGNYKDSAVKLYKRIQASFVQGSLKWQNKNYEGWYLNRRKIHLFSDQCSVTKLYNYSETNYPLKKSTLKWNVYNLKELKHLNANSM